MADINEMADTEKDGYPVFRCPQCPRALFRDAEGLTKHYTQVHKVSTSSDSLIDFCVQEIRFYSV